MCFALLPSAYFCTFFPALHFSPVFFMSLPPLNVYFPVAFSPLSFGFGCMFSVFVVQTHIISFKLSMPAAL